jgi:hypothetical protein
MMIQSVPNPPRAIRLFGEANKDIEWVFWLLLGLIALGRLWVASLSNVIWEEGHFVVSGSFPDLGYPDIPAGFAWISYLITKIFGWSLEAHRGFSFIIATLIPIGVIWMAKAYVPLRDALWAGIIAAFLPQLAVNGTVYYPEGSLQLCLALMLGAFGRAARISFDPIRPWHSLKWWALTGIIAGIGLLIHFRFLAPGLAMFLFLLASKPGRKLWHNPGLYLAGLCALLGLVPSLLYNMSHDWPAYQFHIENRPHFDPKIERLIGGALLQAALAGPVIFIGMVAAALKLWPERNSDIRSVLGFQAVIIFCVYVLQGALNKKIMPHWPFMAFVPLLPFLPMVFRDFMARASSQLGVTIRRLIVSSSLIWALAMMAGGAAYQYLWAHSAAISPALRVHNFLKNEDWRPLYPVIEKAKQRAKTRFGHEAALATEGHVSATRLEFPAAPKSLYHTLDDPYDVEVSRFSVARKDWGLDYAALMSKGEGQGVVLVLNEPSYLYHQPELFDLYDRLCAHFDALEPFQSTDLSPGKTRLHIYTALLSPNRPRPDNWQNCPLYPRLYIAQPMKGDRIKTGSDENFYGIAVDAMGIKSVDIYLDDKLITNANYGLNPEGFLAPKGLNFDPNYPRVQFDFKIPKINQMPGQYSLSIRATTMDGRVIISPPRVLYIDP